jgi:hypothetical protein
MGNTATTNLNIDRVCDLPVSRDNKDEDIEVKLTMHLEKLSGGHLKEPVTWFLSKKHCSHAPIHSSNSCLKVEWTPTTHMRDFEVTGAFSDRENKIARGQGVGVVVIPELDFYCKFAFCLVTKDTSQTWPCNFGSYKSGHELRSFLQKDLGLGYDVLVIEKLVDKEKARVESLCEARDERDAAPIPIFLSSLQSMSHYKFDDADD